MTRDTTLMGVVLMLAFCVIAPLLDVGAKLAAENGVPVGQVTTARFVVQTALMLPVVFLMRLPLQLSPKALGYTTLRALFLLVSTYAFVSGIQVMPIADALAIVFVEPFILLILGHFLFKDQVGPRRIALFRQCDVRCGIRGDIARARARGAGADAHHSMRVDRIEPLLCH